MKRGGRIGLLYVLPGLAGLCVFYIAPFFYSLRYIFTRGVSQVELVGLVSNICVLSNAVLARAALPQARIRIDAACTLGPDPALHQKALDVMQGLGIEVYNR